MNRALSARELAGIARPAARRSGADRGGSRLPLFLALLIAATALGAEARAARVGYIVLGKSQDRSPEPAIRAAGHEVARLAELSRVTTTQLDNLDVLWLLNPSGRIPTDTASRRKVADFVRQGGVLLLHDRDVNGTQLFLPGGSGLVLTPHTTPAVDVLDDTTTLTAGPGGAIDDATLDGGNSSAHGYAATASIPEGGVAILGWESSPDRAVDLSYPFELGWVHYSTIPLDFYLDGGGSASIRQRFNEVYAVNAVAYAAELSRFGGLDRDGDGLSDRLEIELGLDPDDPLDAAADGDGDGLTSFDEAHLGTNPLEADTDGDGLADGAEVNEAGTDPLEADTDGDGVLDGADPFPAVALLARLALPPSAVVGEPAPVRVELFAGAAPLELAARFTLDLSGDGTFAEAATTGTLLGGGGTSAVLLESSGGVVEIAVRSGVAAPLGLRVVDSEGVGILFRGGVEEDFETSDGGFTHSGLGDEWEWGIPTAGPGRARSGRRVWATDLDGEFLDNADSWLETPAYRLPAGEEVALEYWQFFESEDCCDLGWIEISADGGPYAKLWPPGEETFHGFRGGYERVLVGLEEFLGRDVRFRFRLRTDSGSRFSGWTIDDLRIPATRTELPVVDPDGDDDFDGLSNRREFELGTDPFRADTDGDGLEDGVESGSGVFAGPGDTGSDPTLADSDGGGQEDGVEVELGLDPNTALDDFNSSGLPVTFLDGEGFRWDLRGDGAIVDGTQNLFDDAFFLQFPEVSFPGLRSARIFAGGNRQTALLGPTLMGEVLVERLIDVKREGDGFARYLETFHNEGAAAVDLEVRISGRLARSSSLVLASSNEETARGFDPADDWVVIDDPIDTTAPVLTLVLGGLAGSLPLSAASHTGRDFSWSWRFAVGAGERVSLLWFAAQSSTPERARAKAEELSRLEGSALQGVSEAQLARVVNFGRDRDRDGLPDDLENALGLDPGDPADAAGDLDGDGLANLEEFRLQTRLDLADTDEDGLDDGEEVRSRGTDPLSADTDGDGVDDSEDPFPTAEIRVVLDLPSGAIVGAAFALRARLEPAELLRGTPVRIRIVASGASAAFAAEAREGTVVEAPEPGTVLLETTTAAAEIDLTASAEGEVAFSVEDPGGIGLVFQGEVQEDFEAGDGGFTHSGTLDVWEWGVPASGPRAAHSGSRLWATSLSGAYGRNADFSLQTPAYSIPSGTPARLEFWHWYLTDGCCDRARVEVSRDGGDFEPLPGLPEFRAGGSGRFQKVSADLAAFAGSRVRFRFRLVSDGSTVRDGWYIDDFRLAGTRGRIEALPAGGDADGDGLSNLAEVERSTDPLSSDTDGDGLSDSVETGTGLFAGAEDTGTDPLRADTDGGGLADREEIDEGLDPFDPTDDLVPGTTPVSFIDAEGFQWDLRGNGSVGNGTNGAFEGAGWLRIENDGFPGDSSARVFIGGGRQELYLGPRPVASLEVERRVTVPTSGDGFARWFDTVRNPTASAADTTLRITGSVSRSHQVVATSSGDASFTAEDQWVVFDDQDLAGLPAVTLVLGGLQPDVVPSELSYSGASFQWDFPLQVEAGGSVSFLLFAAQSNDRETAIRKGEELSRLLGGALAGLSPAHLSRVVNFGRDRDLDGLPDGLETELGLDPDDPADAGDDLDADGLTNLEEFRLGTRLDLADSDEDGLSDAEEVNGSGTDPLLADTDRDGVGDGEDPLPGVALTARLEIPRLALTGRAFPVRVLLEPREALGGLQPRFSLRATEGASRFAAEASAGTVISGGESSLVVLEPAGGVAEIDLLPLGAQSISIAVEDSFAQGIVFQGEVFHDFEISDGGFEHGGTRDEWQWGEPRGGPGAAHSGSRLWATDLAGGYESSANQWLQSPEITLPGAGELRLEFWHWYSTESCCDRGALWISPDGAEFERIPDTPEYRGSSGDWQPVEVDLDPWRGRTVRIQFVFTSDGSVTRDGWYLDDFRIVGTRSEVLALVPSGDEDEDGVTNERELEIGTDPTSGDSDRDGLSDGVETGTGVFRGPADTGTDPTLRDTDGAGLDDGLEVRLGLDPTSSEDEPTEQSFPVVLTDPEGFRWDVQPRGTIGDGTADAFNNAFRLRVGDTEFADQPRALQSPDGEEVILGPATLEGLDVVREVRVAPRGLGAARYLEVLHNPTDRVIRTTVQVFGTLGSGNETEVVATSSGDASFSRADDWLITDDQDGVGDPTLLFVLGGPGGRRRPTEATLSRASFSWRWSLTVEPGATAAVLWLAAQSTSREAARAKAEPLHALEGEAGAEIPGPIADGVVNFDLVDPATFFLRGDANNSSEVDLSDAIYVLNWLYHSAPDPREPDAADANDDGRIDVSDPVRILIWLFRGAAPLPPPFPEPGRDPTGDGL